MYTVEFTKKALQYIDKLDKGVHEQIVSALERIRIRPQDFLIKLVGEEGYKFRVGDYRLFIDLAKDKLIILPYTIAVFL